MLRLGRARSTGEAWWKRGGRGNKSIYMVIGVSLSACVTFLLLFRLLFSSFGRLVIPPPPQVPRLSLHVDDAVRAQACRGPRATLYDEPIEADSPESVLHLPEIQYPEPLTGSYEALGIEKTWMTFEQRYGPYGFNETSEDHGHSRVDWTKVDWGALTRTCVEANSARFNLPSTGIAELAIPRFRLAGQGDAPQSPKVQTGRQAVVLRTWSTYEYTPEDMWNIRSLVSETSLATGGQYSVILLVDVKCENCSAIHTDDDFYRETLETAVPEEFRDLAVLFHDSLQHSWYRKVEEFLPFWQIMQPLQLFAHFYPEFDHYWQFEMDTRFTGHAGKLIQAFHEFGKKQPYKQASERASWHYMPRLHGSWDDFSKTINQSLNGGATVWGPVKIDAIEPIGPVPPVSDPKDDDFEYGVGVDADLLLPSTMHDVTRFESEKDWVFKNHYTDNSVPRFMSVPAQARASYDLLEAIHQTQHTTGYRAPSEGTLPSFALWHGLKVVGLPVPIFQYPSRNVHEMNFVFNGGYPSEFKDGIAQSQSAFRASSFAFFVRPLSWAWSTTLVDPLYEWWMGHELPSREPTDRPDIFAGTPIPSELPPFMAKVDGKTYAPNLLLHPRKTNNYRSPE